MKSSGIESVMLAQFKQRYKQFPKASMKVDVVTDDNGNWKITL